MRSKRLGVLSLVFGWAVVAAAIAAIAIVVIAEGGCGGSSSMPQAAACGTSGALAGMDCTSVKQCGAGAPNYVEVPFCQHCFARSDTDFCEAGKCRKFDPQLTNIDFNFTIPAGAMGAKSFTIATLDPIMADGTRLTCAALTGGGCDFVNNAMINARNSRYNLLPDMGDLAVGQISIDPAPGQLIFVQITTGVQGTGEVKATGCAENIDVTKGQAHDPVSITMK